MPYKSRSDNIQIFIEIAKEREGKCNSNEYSNQSTKLNFQCKNGHSFTMRASVVKRGAWCPTCQRVEYFEKIKNEYSHKVLLDLESKCNKNNGKIISGNYKNSKSKFIFECKQKHQWETTPYLILKGHWCKICSSKITSDKQKDDIQTFIDIAISKGGKCLSTEYINAQNKLLFECSEGHQWMGRPQGIKIKGTWCRKCYGTAKSDIQEMKSIAIERGGVCLSEEYISDASKLVWKCCEEHIWEATPNNIKHNKWCPTCSEGIGERVCRLFFQKIFGYEFVKIRPDWLKNSTGFLLELDGYCKELNLAFEHQGRQHYSEVSFFSKKNNYDVAKRKLCKQKGVTLIEIPEIFSDTKIKNLKSFIIQECLKNNVVLPKNINEIEITPFEIFTYTKNQERKLLVQKAEEKIVSKGGSLLETHLTDTGISFKVLCSNGHHWNIKKANLFQDKWCPYCKHIAVFNSNSPIPKKPSKKNSNPNLSLNKRELAITTMLEIANLKQGTCLSEIYVNDSTKLSWKCKEGHEWSSTPTNIKSGRWCPKCAGNFKSSIIEIAEIIQKRGGKCLSKSYENNYSKIEIECENGHRFNTMAKSIKRGNWCSYCAIEKRGEKRKKNITDMHTLAAKKNGKCLSEVYINISTKLLWECEKKHQFYSRPSNVHTGYWCPKCAINNIVDRAAIEREKILKQILLDKQGEAIFNDKKFNPESEIAWKCCEGHIWKSRIENILAGHWCPSCSNKKRWIEKKTNIQDIREFAQLKGGDCLSDAYIDSLTKLKFQCANEHTWLSLWSNVKSKGSWCPKCAIELRKKTQ